MAGETSIGVWGFRGEGGRETGRSKLGVLDLTRASMDSAAFILDDAELELVAVADVLEGVVGRVDGVPNTALILELTEDAVVEVNDGVVERVDAVRAFSEWLLSEDSGREGVGREVIRLGGLSMPFRGDGGGDPDIGESGVCGCVGLCTPHPFQVGTFSETGFPCSAAWDRHKGTR